jgi:hypothetical protein
VLAGFRRLGLAVVAIQVHVIGVVPGFGYKPAGIQHRANEPVVLVVKILFPQKLK